MESMLKEKTCQQCEQPFTPRKRMQRVCGLQCAVEQSRQKQREAAERGQKKRDRQRKEKLKNRNVWLAETQTAFNRYIRARDYWDDCISCGATKARVEFEQGWKAGGCWDAGHYRTRAAASQLRFNLLGCHKQCKSCNGGNGKYQNFGRKKETVTAQYRENLIKKIGLERVDQLENDNSVRKFDIEYLKRLKNLMNKRARYYEKRRGIE